MHLASLPACPSSRACVRRPKEHGTTDSQYVLSLRLTEAEVVPDVDLEGKRVLLGFGPFGVVYRAKYHGKRKNGRIGVPATPVSPGRAPRIQ